MSFDYQQIQEIGIVSGILSTIGIALVALVRRIYCKGKNDACLIERITLLERWKETHLREYQDLIKVNEEVKEGLADVGKKIAYLTGLLEGNGTKE